ncbi:lanC-like protein 3 homolog [Dendronephthya gigantea]|uniref:lanC-like protein 3 homolog n=1 Tax=Dendronephthya gigantea TaxID=151771 RepID=UPI00106B2743|nr:lanC-like protein 3 homolog [Dendronephthya gigantea]
MYRNQRYFKNSLPDFTTGGQNENCDFIQDLIKSYVEEIEERFKPTPNNANGGLYLGASGVAFMYLKMACSESFQEKREELLQKALAYIKVGIEDAKKLSSSKTSPVEASFLLGHAGVFGVASVIFNELGDATNKSKFIQKFLQLSHNLQLNQQLLQHGANELLIGRAGYLCVVRWLQQVLGESVVPANMIDVLFNAIVTEGRSYSREHRSQAPLMYAYYSTESVGAAHGLSGILQMLLCFPAFFDGKSDVETDIKNTADFILHCKKDNGNYPATVGKEEDEGDELVHWCHGAPGVVYLLVKVYLQWREEKYLKAAFECGDIVWEKGLLTKGPGICHGVAGNSYVFLLLYRVTNDEKYLHRAIQFAKFLTNEEFIQGARTPDAPYSLFEGLAGTVCYLVDLLDPKKASFPFFNVL